MGHRYTSSPWGGRDAPRPFEQGLNCDPPFRNRFPMRLALPLVAAIAFGAWILGGAQ